MPKKHIRQCKNEKGKQSTSTNIFNFIIKLPQAFISRPESALSCLPMFCSLLMDLVSFPPIKTSVTLQACHKMLLSLSEWGLIFQQGGFVNGHCNCCLSWDDLGGLLQFYRGILIQKSCCPEDG